MVIYIIIYLFILIIAFAAKRFKFKKDLDVFCTSLLFLLLLVFIGLRHEVGGDWSSYLYWYNAIRDKGFDFSVYGLLFSDFGYNLANWISAKLNLGIYLVNTICGFIYLYGLFKFSTFFKREKYDVLLIAYPYLTMIVATGYTRQSAALGLVFLSLYFFLTNRYILSYLPAFAALFFHKSSAIFLLFLVLVTPWRKRNPFALLMIVVSLAGLFALGYQEIFMRFYSFYVESQMESEGGTLRAIMNFIPAAGFLFTRRYWNKLLDSEQLKVWFVISIIVLVLSSFAILKLTFGDRLLLYFSVIQFLFFVWIEKLFREKETKAMIYFAIIMIYTAALLVWLLFAKHREAWIPYSNLVFEALK